MCTADHLLARRRRCSPGVGVGLCFRLLAELRRVVEAEQEQHCKDDDNPEDYLSHPTLPLRVPMVAMVAMLPMVSMVPAVPAVPAVPMVKAPSLDS